MGLTFRNPFWNSEQKVVGQAVSVEVPDFVPADPLPEAMQRAKALLKPASPVSISRESLAQQLTDLAVAFDEARTRRVEAETIREVVGLAVELDQRTGATGQEAAQIINQAREAFARQFQPDSVRVMPAPRPVGALQGATQSRHASRMRNQNTVNTAHGYSPDDPDNIAVAKSAAYGDVRSTRKRDKQADYASEDPAAQAAYDAEYDRLSQPR